MVNESNTKNITCKNCGSSVVVKFGTYKGNQRFWCKSCQRKFKSDSGFHDQVSGKYISHALDLYFHGMFIKNIASALKQEYNYHPSKSTIFNWANKYTNLIRQQFTYYHSHVGDIWVLDKVRLNINEHRKIWFYYVIDTKTRFLLAFKVGLKRTHQDTKNLIDEACKHGSTIKPKQIIKDSNYLYLDEVRLTHKKKAEHIGEKTYTSKNTINLIKRFHGIHEDRAQLIRYFTDIEKAVQFTSGLVISYNYFMRQQNLSGKTPAETAGINYKIKNWSDLINLPAEKLSKTP